MIFRARYFGFIVIAFLGSGDAVLEGPVDLSWAFDEKTAFWPNTKPFNFTKKVAEITEGGFWYAMNEFCTGEHGGTHIDAPYHFNRYGMTVGNIPLHKLIAPGVCIDLQYKTRRVGGNTTLTVDDIFRWENIHGRILQGSIVLVNFGWSLLYDSETYLYDDQKQMVFPGVSKTAAEILAERKVYGVGIDTASVDPGYSQEFPAHRVLAEHDIYALENVKIPLNFDSVGFKLFVLPMKIKEGTGAPVRIIAMPDHILQFPQTQIFSAENNAFWIRNSWVVLFAALMALMYFIHSFSL